MSAATAIAQAFAGWHPSRPPQSHREFAPRTLLPGGPLRGTPFDPSTDPVQNYVIDQLDSGRWKRIYWAAPPQVAGKCWAKGTELRLVNGSLTKVEDVRPGDRLMGGLGIDNEVTTTTTGRGEMFRIVPERFEPFIVNGDHILVLKRQTSGTVICISVRDYLARAPWFQREHRLFKHMPEFGQTSPTIDPYLIGAWIGDGMTQAGQPTIFGIDEPILSYCFWAAVNIGLSPFMKKDPRTGCLAVTMTHRSSGYHTANPLRDYFKSLLVDGKKRLPRDCFTWSRADRMALLAGIIDTDGTRARASSYEIVTKLDGLCGDYKNLAWSLGLAARSSIKMVKGRPYCRIRVSGDLTGAPLLLDRKKPGTSNSIDVAEGLSGFRIERLPEDDYYGFSLTGDRTCVLRDYTVTHNTQCAILIPAMRAVIELRCAVGYGLPTLHDLDRGWQTKVAPTIRDAGLGQYLPKQGPGSKGGRPPSVTFEDPNTHQSLGSFVFLAGSARQVTVRVCVVDELDAWRNAEGAPRWSDLEDVWARADSFQSEAIRIGVGTVECDDPARSILLTCVEQLGTGTRMVPRCPHCGVYDRLEFENFVYEYRNTAGDLPGPDLKHAAETAAYVCPSCATRWTEDDRRKALQSAVFAHKGQEVDAGGIITGAPPQTESLGLRTHALDCILTTQGAIAERAAAAQFALDTHGNHEPLRKFYRYQRVEGYTGDKLLEEDGSTSIPTRNRLAALSSQGEYSLAVDRRADGADSIHLAELPAWVEHQTLAVDVQRGGDRAPGRLYFGLIGRGGGRGAVTGWGSVTSCPLGRQPTTAELHASIDRLQSLLTGWAPRAPIVQRGIDVGDRQDEIRLWLRAHPTWLAIKGTGPLKSERGDHPGWLYRREQAGTWRLWLIETQSCLRICQGELLAGSGVGSLALPSGLDRNSALIRHICATVEYAPGKWSKSPKDRPHHPEWQDRDDYGQCLAYARALAYEWETRPAAPTNTPRNPNQTREENDFGSSVW